MGHSDQCLHQEAGLCDSFTLVNTGASFKLRCGNFLHLLGKPGLLGKKLTIYAATYQDPLPPPFKPKPPLNILEGEFPPKFLRRNASTDLDA